MCFYSRELAIVDEEEVSIGERLEIARIGCFDGGTIIAFRRPGCEGGVCLETDTYFNIELAPHIANRFNMLHNGSPLVIRARFIDNQDIDESEQVPACHLDMIEFQLGNDIIQREFVDIRFLGAKATVVEPEFTSNSFTPSFAQTREAAVLIA